MARKREEPEFTRMDMTPMIDCIFQLMVFFVLINDFSNLEMVPDISIPVAEKISNTSELKKVTINVRAEGAVTIDGAGYTGETLPDKLKALAARHPSRDPESEGKGISDLLVCIRGDRDGKFKYVQETLYGCQNPGPWKISFAAQRPE
jgi:biopolymer transport protein ExbD